MSGFRYELPVRLHSGIGARRFVGQLTHELLDHNHSVSALIVTDRQILSAGLIDDVVASLTAAGISPVIFSDVLADPPQEVILSALDMARREQAGAIIGLGGGSSMDTAKLVALLAANGQSIEDVFGTNMARGPRLPLIQIPTTAGTGSEVTNISIVTTPDHQKKGVVSPHLYADIALLDAELTLGLPASVTAMTGIDAMVHAIEAYTSRLKKNLVSDALARQAITLLAKGFLSVIKDGTDIESRNAMLEGATLAGMAFANAPVAAVHALAYPLGGTFNVPHGLSNALVLAPVLTFNQSAAGNLYGELASVVGFAIGRSVPCDAAWFVKYMAELVASLPFAQRLRDVGVTEADIPALADDAMIIDRLLVNNPREVTRDDALSIYHAVL